MSSMSAFVGGAAALGGVLALAAGWSRGGDRRGIPLLSPGAFVLLGVSAATRAAQLSPEVSVAAQLVAATVLGGLCGWGLQVLHQAVSARDATGGWTADLAGLAGVIGLVAVFTPAAGLHAGPLPGWPVAPEHGVAWQAGVVVAATGVVLALLLARLSADRLPLAARWAGAGASCAALAAVARPLDVAAPVPADALMLALAAALAAAAAWTPTGAALLGMAAGVVLTGAAAAGMDPALAVLLSTPLVLVAAGMRMAAVEA